jgi:hypothetical protein
MNFTIYYKRDQIKKDTMSGACRTDGRDEKCIKYFRWNTGRKEPLGRPRCGWEDNIRMDLREIAWEAVDWMRLAPDMDQ